MNHNSLSDLFAIGRLPDGRRVFALRQLLALAQKEGCAPLVTAAMGALVHEGVNMNTVVQWLNAKNAPTVTLPLRPLDIRMDRLVSACDQLCDDKQTNLPPEHPTAIAAKRIQDRILPAGVTAIIHLTYVEESIAVERILWLCLNADDPRLDDVDSPPIDVSERGSLRNDVVLVGLADYIDELADVSLQFRKLLRTNVAKTTTWGDVRASREIAHEWLLGVIGVVAGTWPQPTPEHRAKRAELLSPILQQLNAVAKLAKQRRMVTDINPDTGAETQAAPTEPQDNDAG